MSEVHNPQEPEVPRRSRRDGKGMAAVTAENFSVLDSLGGIRGMVEATLPGLVFVVWFSLRDNLTEAVIASLAIAGAMTLARVVQRSNVSQAVAGFLGVAVCAVVALWTNQAKDFFLLSIVRNSVSTAVCLISVLPIWKLNIRNQIFPRGPLPIIGVIVGGIMGEGLRWRLVPGRMRAYLLSTYVFAGLFLLRLVVMGGLYLADKPKLLGGTSVALGLPPFAIAAFITWRLLRSAPPTPTAEEVADQESDLQDVAPMGWTGEPEGATPDSDWRMPDGHHRMAAPPDRDPMTGNSWHSLAPTTGTGYEPNGGYQTGPVAAPGYGVPAPGYDAGPHNLMRGHGGAHTSGSPLDYPSVTGSMPQMPATGAMDVLPTAGPPPGSTDRVSKPTSGEVPVVGERKRRRHSRGGA